MAKAVKIGDRWIGDEYPAYIVAEIGINHNGDIEIAKRLMDAARHAGVDAVKFQKRTPELCTPSDQRDQMRDTPWGYISYMDYRRKIEFGQAEYEQIDRYAKKIDVDWFASVWDEPSVEFIAQFSPVAYKVPSAALTDHELLGARATGLPVILSTACPPSKRSARQCRCSIKNVWSLPYDQLLSLPAGRIKFGMLNTLKSEYDCPIGYSGHEVGLIPAVAVALGACLIERHITLDRAMWAPSPPR